MVIEKTENISELKKELFRYKSRIFRLEQELECYKNKEALPDGLDYLDLIVDNINDPVIIKDTEGRLLYVNQAWCRIFNYKKENVLNKADYEVFDNESVNILNELDKKVLSEGLTFSIDEYDNSNGLNKQFDTLRLPLNYPGSKRIHGIITIYRDKYNSGSAEKLWLKLFDVCTDGFYDWKFEEDSFKTSSKTAELCGFRKTILTTQERYDIIHPDDLDYVICTLSEHFSRKTDIFKCQYRILNNKGIYQQIKDTGLVFERNKDNDAARMIGVISFD